MGFGSSRHADANGNGDAYTNCYRYCHCYAYTHSDISYPDGHTDCYSYSYSYGYGHCDSHTNGNVYIYTELDPTTYTFAKAPPAGKNSANAAASSLAGGDWREMSQGREAPMQEAVVF